MMLKVGNRMENFKVSYKFYMMTAPCITLISKMYYKSIITSHICMPPEKISIFLSLLLFSFFFDARTCRCNHHTYAMQNYRLRKIFSNYKEKTNMKFRDFISCL